MQRLRSRGWSFCLARLTPMVGIAREAATRPRRGLFDAILSVQIKRRWKAPRQCRESASERGRRPPGRGTRFASQ
jgi:hypothetical protein